MLDCCRDSAEMYLFDISFPTATACLFLQQVSPKIGTLLIHFRQSETPSIDDELSAFSLDCEDGSHRYTSLSTIVSTFPQNEIFDTTVNVCFILLSILLFQKLRQYVSDKLIVLVQWPCIWMNDLRQHLPLLAVLFIDTRQSANSTFLLHTYCFGGQHQYSILVLQVTDFPTGSALDDHLLHVDQYVNERAVIFVNDFADDAYLRVLRHRGFNVASIVHFDADYILFETQVNGVYFTTGFLVPANRQTR
jgi:hypothetical protein